MDTCSSGAHYVRTSRHAEQFASSVAFDGWDMQYTQMSPGTYEGESREIRFDDLQIYAESWNATAHHSGCAWRDSHVFAIPCATAGEGRLNGQRWNGEISVFRGETTYDSLVPPMTLLVVCIGRDTFADYLASVEHIACPAWLASGTRLMRDPARAASATRALLAMLGACCNDPVRLGDPGVQASLRQTTLQALAPLVAGNDAPAPPSFGSFSRTQIVRRAREFALARIDEPLQIIDVCRALRVSRRVLQYSFEDVLNTNPVAYLRLLRLNGARRDLVGAADRPVTVQEAMARWGFWHGSRFSAEYRKMYGELPSDTLRRTRGLRSQFPSPASRAKFG
jgi:AraC family ethanolamine operon transcriptional activator